MIRKIHDMLLMLSVSVILVGCSTTELEERCFPMLVSVGYENGEVTYGVEFPKEEKGKLPGYPAKNATFLEAKESYENRLNKKADYNHLKVLVIEEDLLERKDALMDMLDVLAQTEIYPRNTYVCVMEGVDEWDEIRESVSQDLGTYLEEYLKQKEEKKNRLLTLGDLIDEKENQTMVLYLPYLEVEENFIQWKGYVNTSGKVWKESY